MQGDSFRVPITPGNRTVSLCACGGYLTFEFADFEENPFLWAVTFT